MWSKMIMGQIFDKGDKVSHKMQDLDFSLCWIVLCRLDLWYWQPGQDNLE